MDETLTLVVLAAGMGSRYGGLKQLAPVGPSGETLMDYSVYDAVRAGFRRAVFVVRPDIEAAVLEHVRGRYGHAIEIETALQRLDDIPAGFTVTAGRTKPWGTTQAVLAAASHVHGPFVVVNADDFYGRRAFEALAVALRVGAASGSSASTYALVGYALRDTASESGPVNRAVCDIDADGWLCALHEMLDLAPSPAGDGAYRGRTPAGEAVEIRGEALVSMNSWGLTPDVFEILRGEFARFLASDPNVRAECYLPESMGDAIRQSLARVRVLDAQSQWLGITYPADRPVVQAALQRLTDAGAYPARLWPHAEMT